MRVLVTNDDGIDSEGLGALARSLCDLADVVVVAPDTEYSGAGAALGALQRIQPEVHRRHIDGIDEAWAVSGPPALCVLFSRLGAFGAPFDLVVAGINPGANVGSSVYHSGTVGAALTARLGGLTGVAVSQAVTNLGVEGQAEPDTLEGQRWETAAAVAHAAVGALLRDLPGEPAVVNINVPNLALAELQGWRPTRVGTVAPRSVDGAVLEPSAGRRDTYGVKMSWGDPVSLPPDTDGGAVERGVVSLTLLGRLAETDPVAIGAVTAAFDTLLG